MPLRPPEIAAKAVVNPDIQVRPNTSPEMAAAKNLQDKLKTDVREAVDTLARVDPVDPRKVAESAGNYTYKNKDGNPVPDAVSWDAEKTSVDQITNYLDNYSTLTPTEKDAIGDKVLSRMKGMPLVADILQDAAGAGATVDLHNTNVKAIVDKLLGDPRYRRDVREALVTGLDHPITAEGEAVGVAERAKVEANRKLTAVHDELDKLTDTGNPRTRPPTAPGSESLAGKTAALKGYTEVGVGYVPANPPTTNAEKIAHGEFYSSTWNDQTRSLQVERDAAVTEKANLEARLTRLQGIRVPNVSEIRERADIPRSITGLDGVISGKNSEIQSVQNNINEFTKLKQARDDLKSEVEVTIPQRIDQLHDQVFTLNEAYQTADKTYSDALSTYKTLVAERVKGFENLLGDQTEQFLRKEIAFAENIEATRLNEALASTQDKQVKDVLGTVGGRWGDTEKHNLMQGKNEQAKKNLQPDLDALIAGGPEALDKQAFYDIDPTTGAYSATPRINPDTGAAYTQPEMDEIMAKPEFEKVRNEMVMRVLGHAARFGMLKDHADEILSSSWGPEEIQKALAWNKAGAEAKRVLEKQLGITNILDPKNLTEFKKNHPQAFYWLLMMLLSPTIGGLVGLTLLGLNLKKEMAPKEK